MTSRINRWIVAALLAGLALMFWGTPRAADWQMLRCDPGAACEVRHIYFDNAGVACQTDAVGERIVRPGVRVKCERVPVTKQAEAKHD